MNIKWAQLFGKRDKDVKGIREFRIGSAPMLRIAIPFMGGIFLFWLYPIHLFMVSYWIFLIPVLFCFTFHFWHFIIKIGVLIIWGYLCAMFHHPYAEPGIHPISQRTEGSFLTVRSKISQNRYDLYQKNGNQWIYIGKGQGRFNNRADTQINQFVVKPVEYDDFGQRSSLPIRFGILYKIYKKNLSNRKELEQEEFIEEVRTSFRIRFFNGIHDSAAAAFYIGLLSGDIQHIPPETLQSFQNTGTMHVLAVSGLHVGLLFLSLGWVLSVLLYFYPYGGELWLKIAIQLAGVWFFTWFAGFPPSVVRAAIMVSVFGMAKAFRYNSNGLNTLGFSALVQLHVSPGDLLGLGFQFSYLAVFIILWIQPLLHYYLRFKLNLLNQCLSMILITCAAQWITLLVSLPSFHSFPLWFLPANLFSIPITTLMTYAGFIFIIPTFLDIYISEGMCWMYYILCFGMSWINSLPFNVITQIPFTIYDTFLFGTSCVGLVMWIRNIYRPFSMYIAILSFFLVMWMPLPSESKVFAGGYGKSSWVLWIRGPHACLISSQQNEFQKRNIEKWALNHGVQCTKSFLFPQNHGQIVWGNFKLNSKQMVLKNAKYGIGKNGIDQDSVIWFGNRKWHNGSKGTLFFTPAGAMCSGKNVVPTRGGVLKLL